MYILISEYKLVSESSLNRGFKTSVCGWSCLAKCNITHGLRLEASGKWRQLRNFILCMAVYFYHQVNKLVKGQRVSHASYNLLFRGLHLPLS